MFKRNIGIPLALMFLSAQVKAQEQDLSSKQDTLTQDKVIDAVHVSGQKNKYKDGKPSSSLRLDTELLKVPQSVQVITNDLIVDQQLYSMSDAIARNVSGAARIEEWGDMYTYITMRGTRAAAFRNGMNTSWMYGILSEDMSFVDRIEFVKGPAGFMLSNGEPSGIYNVVSKRPTGTLGGTVSLGMGSYDLYRTSLDIDGVLNKCKSILFRLNVAAQSNNSFRPYESTKRLSIAPVLQFQLAEKTSLSLEYIGQYAQLPNLGVSYLFSKTGYGSIDRNSTLSDPGLEATDVDDHNLTANLEHEFNENWRLRTQLSYFDYRQKGSFIWTKSLDESGNIQRINYSWDALNEMTFGQAVLNGKFKTGKIKHSLMGGLDLSRKSYVADFAQSHVLDSIGTYNTHTNTYQKPYYDIGTFDRSLPLKERVGTGFLLETRVMGLYLQDELAFFADKLRLTLAGRYSYVQDNNYGAVVENKRFTPRVGVSYSLDAHSNLYALYDQTFVPQSGRLRAGGGLKPMTGTNMELGAKKDWLDGKWNTTLAVYRIMKENQASPDPDNIGGDNYFLQFGETKTQGLEFDLRGEILTGLDLMANYAFTESKVTKSTSKHEKGMIVPGYAKHNMNLWVNYRLPKGAFEGISVSSGIMYMLDRATWWNGNHDGEGLPDYFRLDGAVSWAKDKFTLSLHVNNLLDSYLYNGAHHSSGWYYWRPEAPRNYRLNVTYTF